MRPRVAALLWLLSFPSGRGMAQQADLNRMVDSFAPTIESATGLRFRYPAKPGLRTRAEVREHVARSFARSFSPERLHALAVGYHLIGLLPDTAAFEKSVVGLQGDALVGYYDPATDSLFAVTGTPPGALREIILHEMVHAVQGQHLDLVGLLQSTSDSDERLAARALIEGQAMFATMRILVPRRNVVAEDNLWNFVTDYLRQQQLISPRSKQAPLWLREGTLAPYLYGARFASFWNASKFGDTLPYGPRMPRSTEQILHFARYAAGDQPLQLRFADDSAGGVLTEDVLGELQLQMLAAELARAVSLGPLSPMGWGGDRYRVYRTLAGPALVWYLVWDDEESAQAFHAGPGVRLAARKRAGYRSTLDALTLDGRAASRYVLAPEGWAGWAAIPQVAPR